MTMDKESANTAVIEIRKVLREHHFSRLEAIAILELSKLIVYGEGDMIKGD